MSSVLLSKIILFLVDKFLNIYLFSKNRNYELKNLEIDKFIYKPYVDKHNERS